MLKWLDKWDIEELEAKKPKLRERLEDWRADEIDVDLWELEAGGTGKRPLLLLARLKFFTGAHEYRLILCQPGKDGALYSWECPGVMPGAVNRGGRPREYGVEAAKYVQKWRQEGMSIRQIARKGGCSTFTVQRLLKYPVPDDGED